MDFSIIFDLFLLIFALMLLAAVAYIPYRVLHFCMRGMIKTTVKTGQTFWPTKH